MHEYVKLPFSPAPVVSCYPYNGISLAIIQGNTTPKQIAPWLCGKYLNCVFMENSPREQFAICTVDVWGTGDGVVLFNLLHLYRKNLQVLEQQAASDFFKTLLHSGYYVSTYYNGQEIPHTIQGMEPTKRQVYILHGYDDTRQVFFAAEYLLSGDFRLVEVSYKDFYQYLLVEMPEKIIFQLILYNPETVYCLRPERILSELSDYVHSTSSREPLRDDRAYGMAGVGKLKEHFTQTAYVDVRYTRALLEHKKMMLFCMEHLGYSDLTPLQEICAWAEEIYALGPHGDFAGIGERIDAILAQEEQCLPRILNWLQGGGFHG